MTSEEQAEAAALKWLTSGDVPLRLDLAYERGWLAGRESMQAVKELSDKEIAKNFTKLAQMHTAERERSQKLIELLMRVHDDLVERYNKGLRDSHIKNNIEEMASVISEYREVSHD